MHEKYYKLIIATLVGTLVGLYSSLIVHKIFYLSIDPQIGFEINPLEIISIAINIFLAFYIARTITKKQDVEKTEKDLIANYFREFKNDFSGKLDTLLLNENFDSPRTNSDFKVLRKRLKAILSLAIEYKFLPENSPLVTEVSQVVKEIWTLFTDMPRIPHARTPAQVKEDLARLRLEKISKIENNAIEMDKLIFHIIMKINRK